MQGLRNKHAAKKWSAAVVHRHIPQTYTKALIWYWNYGSVATTMIVGKVRTGKREMLHEETVEPRAVSDTRRPRTDANCAALRFVRRRRTRRQDENTEAGIRRDRVPGRVNTAPPDAEEPPYEWYPRGRSPRRQRTSPSSIPGRRPVVATSDASSRRGIFGKVYGHNVC
jgi:hypothetical protein